MKKRFFYIFISSFFLFPCLNAQEEIRDNLIGIDFHAFGTSFHYAGRIGNELYLGVEGGLFPDIFDWVLLAGRWNSKDNTIWSKDKSYADVNNIDQLIFAHAFVRWKPKIGWFEVDTGLRWGSFNRSGIGIDTFHFNRFIGGYFKPLLGLKQIKIGFRLDFGDMSVHIFGVKSEFVIIASPLIRINFL